MLNDDIVSACARPETVARFWAKVDTSGECWAWKGTGTRSGYGHFFVAWRRPNRKVQTGAHRFSWALANGRIPEGAVICHRCDNPSCVNPAHLFVGSQADNVRDCNEKGRRPRGETHPARKLNDQQVREIRALRGKMFQREIAAMYGVSQDTICLVQTRKHWPHVA